MVVLLLIESNGKTKGGRKPWTKMFSALCPLREPRIYHHLIIGLQRTHTGRKTSHSVTNNVGNEMRDCCNVCQFWHCREFHNRIAAISTYRSQVMIMGRDKLVGRQGFTPHLASSPNLAFCLRATQPHVPHDRIRLISVVRGPKMDAFPRFSLQSRRM
jgi:hypothetical protein